MKKIKRTLLIGIVALSLVGCANQQVIEQQNAQIIKLQEQKLKLSEKLLADDVSADEMLEIRAKIKIVDDMIAENKAIKDSEQNLANQKTGNAAKAAVGVGAVIWGVTKALTY